MPSLPLPSIKPADMRFWRHVAAILILLSLYLQTALTTRAAVNVPMQDEALASIELSALAEFWDGIGWMPVQIHVLNRAPVERTWRFDFDAGPAYGSGVNLAHSESVTVSAGGDRTVVVFVPGSAGSDGYNTTQIHVKTQGPGVQATYKMTVLNTRHRESMCAIAVSPSLENDVRTRVPPKPATGYTPEVFELSVIEAARWPADWRMWTPFQNVTMTRGEFESLSGDRQAALLDWVAQGGRLWLPGDENKADTKTQNHGFGQVLYKRMPVESGKVSGDDVLRREQPWNGMVTLLDAKDRVDWQLERGTGWLILFLLVFGVLVGPANLFYFAANPRRHRLFFTVPLMAVVASLLLCVVIVLIDGFGGRGVRKTVVMLVPGAPKAVVAQEQRSRTGVLFGHDFALDDTTLMFVRADQFGNGRSRAVSLSRSNGIADGEWFASRTVREQTLWRIEPTRARIERVMESGNGAPVIQSTVAYQLSDFVYRDAKGNWWTTQELVPGQPAVLQKGSPPDPGAPAKNLGKGMYFARGRGGESAPIATLASIEWIDTDICYFGMLEEVSR